VLEALTQRDDDPGPRVGYLVGVREARFAVPFLPAGQAFEVTARLTGSAPPLSIYEITAGGRSPCHDQHVHSWRMIDIGSTRVAR
jgi:predicted hotdog family 3-hydroxylacyl-ACP dehydratase